MPKMGKWTNRQMDSWKKKTNSVWFGIGTLWSTDQYQRSNDHFFLLNEIVDEKKLFTIHPLKLGWYSGDGSRDGHCNDLGITLDGTGQNMGYGEKVEGFGMKLGGI